MFSMIFYGGIALAVLTVWIEYRCAVLNKKFYTTSKSIWWNRMYKWRYLIAFLIVPVLLLEYPVTVDDTSYRIIGFPLMAAAFDSDGTDYVGSFTGIFLLIDAVLLYFLIHVFICILRRWVNERKDDV